MLEQLALRGTVALLALVDEKGNVAEVKVDRAVCSEKGGEGVAEFGAREIREFERVLGEAAKRSATRWRFAPATKRGVPVRVWMTIRIEF
jgi:outer membrane biosynthesis protein TonB